MIMKKIVVVLFGLKGFLVFFVSPSLSAANPIVSFEKSAVVAGDLTPGGDAVFFGVAIEDGEWMSSLVRREKVLADPDRDGIVRLDLATPVAWRSVWAVVDMTSGAFSIVTPGGYPRREMQLRGLLFRENLGVLNRLETHRAFLEILMVRPGVDAWVLSVAEGGRGDENGPRNGHATSSLAMFRSITGKTSPPERLNYGDLVIVVDPDRLDFAAVSLAR